MSDDERLENFSNIIATTSLTNIVSAVAQALEGVLAEKPLIEVMKTASGITLFREDQKYITLGCETKDIASFDVSEFNPFTADGPAVGDVFCEETKARIITLKNLQRVWGSLYFDFIPNPILHKVVADVLNTMLNGEQAWAKLYHKPHRHPLYRYLSLEKVIENYAPHLIPEHINLVMDIEADKNTFMHEIFLKRPHCTVEFAEAAYASRGQEYAESLKEQFWDKRQLLEAVENIAHSLERTIMSLFTTVRAADERLSKPAHGYDVFYVNIEPGNQLVVKNIGDYRILHWELHQ